MFNSLPMSARNRDGTNVLLSYSTAPIVDPDGRVAGTMAVVYDITEKMRLETALRESLGKITGVVDEREQ
jgi:PAS domain S-box-containing protein